MSIYLFDSKIITFATYILVCISVFINWMEFPPFFFPPAFINGVRTVRSLKYLTRLIRVKTKPHTGRGGMMVGGMDQN